MQKLKKHLPKIILVAAMLIIVLIVIFSLNDIHEIGKVLKNVNWIWLWAAIGMLLLYILVYPLALCILGKSKKEESISFKDSYMIATTEYFFNGITPFSSGGQPFQIYAYNQLGVPLHRSSGIILLNFVASQTALVVLCILAFFYYPKLTMDVVYLKVMIFVGLFINVFILLLFIAVGISKTLRKLATRFVQWFFNLKIFKGKMNKKILSFESYCDGAQETFKALVAQKGKFTLCIVTKIIAFICYYCIPFFILKALNIEVGVADIAIIVAMTTFAVAMTCYIPTPGSAGGIEFAFQSLFVTLLPQISATVAISGVLLWRFITYYLLMLISFIVYLIFESYVSHKKKFEMKVEEIDK